MRYERAGMSGSVELDQDGAHLVIRFAYREDLVAIVKELPGRRWDPKGKVWRVPASHVEQVYAVFSRHLFDFAPEIPSLLAGTLGAPPPPANGKPAPRPAQLELPGTAAAGPGEAPALSISQLNARVRDGLRQQFRDSFWVVGEIVDFDKSAGRDHRFFQLVEKARGGEARPLAAVEVALFGKTADRLLPALAAGDPPLTLRDGLEIRVLVKVDLYVQTGRYQVVVQDIDPSFTLGKLALTREQILRELAQKGLADRNRALGFRVPTLRVGVLTSQDADGWNDFLQHLQDSRIGFQVTLFPVKVQGVELKPTLLAGLAWFAAREQHFDVLCIVRGGGSRSDLAWFDDRDVAFAVARHPLKVLVGIGHQRDQSVLDAIAHSEKTPTAVAELLVRGVEEARADLRERAARLRTAVTGHLVAHTHGIAARARALQRAVAQQLTRARADLVGAGRELGSNTRLRLQHERSSLRHAIARARHGAQRRLERAAGRLDDGATRIRLLDPTHVLARGFAIVRDAGGRVVPAAARVTAGASIQVAFRDGHVDAHVHHVHPRQP